MAECVVRVDSNGTYLLLNRETGVEYARGTEAEVVRAAAGVHTITEAPRLGPVRQENTATRHREFVQLVGESAIFEGREYIADETEWISGVLYPDHLGIGFAERLADLPQFVRGVQELVGQLIDVIRGTASVALPGDAPLLGDWIEHGRFEAERIRRRFCFVLGDDWEVLVTHKNQLEPDEGHVVSFERRVESDHV